ncbi:bifunctional heptose 7-phosphate kinase/heptose 1-phosphate adenyltransferase [Kineosporia sp. J2-2]|uniref:Bifunctional heptose 7-phosphate kinase/heptose 1-phosphate adenyltransferase n=1 Tax=Kineosporia corallincola TaxID=2835133 RepID=A0ABS5TGW7_9ACTN|nr:PfkB family carbohydrate kinase [Kineosporia corallincola]MBT0769634.1 bifunctional heptose 7-phosphate kinase/heptose 1-phosphate adenyltransferase [Kineosporia corallincola]
MTRHVVVLGDLLLDRDVHGSVTRIAPDAPVPVLDASRTAERPGGAGLTALLCVGEGVRVTLVAPVADDHDGRRLRDLLAPHVRLLALGHEGGTRTRTRLRASGQCLLRLDEGGPGTPVPDSVDRVDEVLESADVVLVSDYGAGVTRHPELRELLVRAAARRPVLWDPHPRGGDPVPGCLLVTPNLAEAEGALRAAGEPAGTGVTPDVLATRLRERWRVRGVCVTAGEAGAHLSRTGSETLYVPARPAAGDPCGAGDRFAASVAVGLAGGRVLSEAVTAAVGDASAWVEAGGTAGFAVGSTPAREAGATGRGPGLEAKLAATRAAGGRVVATGGCFDLLHVGHLSCLRAARRAGDLLVVLLNSDASVSRLKGPGRPVVPQNERAEVLRSLECVDDVVIFDEDDPGAALERLRPDVWVKGGDYGGAPMPEAGLVRSWGGRVLLLPYLSGRSTTAMLDRAERDHELEEIR